MSEQNEDDILEEAAEVEMARIELEETTSNNRIELEETISNNRIVFFTNMATAITVIFLVGIITWGIVINSHTKQIEETNRIKAIPENALIAKEFAALKSHCQSQIRSIVISLEQDQELKRFAINALYCHKISVDQLKASK